jgi:nucleoside-diphosphate-sugar epimerase
MKRVLVTGAKGFIGRHCLPLLLARGYEVHAVSRHAVEQSLPGTVWHQCDLFEKGCPSRLVKKTGPEYLLHLAWYAIPGKFWESPENTGWVRVSLDLFNAFEESGGKRLVAAGTCAEYAGNAGECGEETTPLLPSTLYGSSKHALERGLRSSYSKRGKLPYAWARVFHLYGAYENPARLVAYAVRSLLRGEPALCSNGLQLLDLLQVEDVASAFVELLVSDVTGAVNIGSGNPVEVREVLNEIGRQIGRPQLIRLGAKPSASNTTRLWANTEKLAKELGWKPHYDLTGGIKRTIEWWRTTGDPKRSRVLESE